MKTKADKLEVDKLATASVDLKKISDVVKNEVFKRLYVINWLKKLKLLPLHGSFLPNIKYFGYKIGIQFNKAPLVVKQ